MSTTSERPAPRVRFATEADLPPLLELMRGLAEFEGYAREFAVTEEVLRDQGFRREPPDFHALVVAGAADGELLGMLVYYFVPFTFRARPTLFIKELFVATAARGRGIGRALMAAALAQAKSHGCALVKWQVARFNEAGKRFYESLGAQADDEWVDYGLGVDL